MKNTNFKKFVSLILCGVLIAAIALTSIGCQDTNPSETPQGSVETTTGSIETVAPTVMGEGNTLFYFSVVDGEGNTTHFEIHTDETTVGAALLALNLIEGEDGAYGLYVKKVNGIRADYDKDGTYWAFYENGDYALSGVDTTTVTAGASYAFKVTKG